MDAFVTCFRNGRSWRLPSVAGLTRNARFGSTPALQSLILRAFQASVLNQATRSMRQAQLASAPSYSRALSSPAMIAAIVHSVFDRQIVIEFMIRVRRYGTTTFDESQSMASQNLASRLVRRLSHTTVGKEQSTANPPFLPAPKSARLTRTLTRFPGGFHAMRRLGRTDLRIAPMVLGGNVFGWTADKTASFAVLDRFAAAGLAAIDTADVYS